MTFAIRMTDSMREAAPVISLALVLVLPFCLVHSAGKMTSSHVGMDDAAVAAAFEVAPYRIGTWAGKDVPLPAAATRMLRPNAVLSRRYVNLESHAALTVMVVHCTDARDMVGHYPPICYPSHGWVPERDQQRVGSSRRHEHGRRVTLHSAGIDMEMQVYEFARLRGWAEETRIRVFNFFVLPQGIVTNDIEDVYDHVNWLGAGASSVAQVQILTQGSMPEHDAARAAGEVLEGLEVVFQALGVKRHVQSH